MAQLDQYLQYMVENRASDLHISADEPVRIRIDGDLVEVHEQALTNEQVEALLYEMLTEEERERFLKNKNLDRSYAIPGIGNFRFNFFLTRRGMAAVIRAIPSKIPTMEELGLPETVQKLTESDKGLILVTGPTGSGKSTTLAAMINHINTNHPYHILTVEDPVEFVHPSKRSLLNQREIGPSCHTFADALKFALREDPDVILVGELRDLETMSLAMTAAETGHLVFGTLHTRGAAASVDRIIDSFPANQQAMIRTMLSESLIAVISQALLKRAGGKGRVAAYEIMVTNHAISNLIREGKTFQIQSTIQTSRKEGMVLMEQYVRDLIANNVVAAQEGEAFLASIGKGDAHGKGKSATPTMPQRTPAPPPSAPKGFVPEPLELTNHSKIIDLKKVAAADKAAKPAVTSAAARPAATPKPAANTQPKAAPAPAAKLATAAPAAKAAPAPSLEEPEPAAPVAKPATAAMKTAIPTPAAKPAVTAPAAKTATATSPAKPVAPPPMAAAVRPKATSAPAAPKPPPASSSKSGGNTGKFAPLSENDAVVARPRPTPPPPWPRPAAAAPPSDIPEPTLLTDLTSMQEDHQEPSLPMSDEVPADAEPSFEEGEIGEIDFSISGDEPEAVSEDPNEPLNDPHPKKKAG